MNRFLVIASLLLVLSIILSACGSVTVDIQPPGDSGGGGEDAGQISTIILYGILILAGAAVLIALLALFRR